MITCWAGDIHTAEHILVADEDEFIIAFFFPGLHGTKVQYI
jgi:hypothetical protein